MQLRSPAYYCSVPDNVIAKSQQVALPNEIRCPVPPTLRVTLIGTSTPLASRCSFRYITSYTHSIPLGLIIRDQRGEGYLSVKGGKLPLNIWLIQAGAGLATPFFPVTRWLRWVPR